MEAIELRKTDELEKHIKTLVEQFIQDVGSAILILKLISNLFKKWEAKGNL